MRELRTDSEGRVAVHVNGPESNFFFRLYLQSDEAAAQNWFDWAKWSAPPWHVETATNQNDVPVQDYGTQVLGNGSRTPECAAFEGLRRAYADYAATVGPPPVRYIELKTNAFLWSLGAQTWRQRFLWGPGYPPGPQPGTFTYSMREFAKGVFQGLVTFPWVR
jgi:hypothetical protein